MKRTHKQPINLSVTRLFDQVARHCKSKRAKIVLKHIVKKPEMAMLSSMAGAMANYVDASQDEVNILLYQARKNDIFDHGRWLVLLAYLVNNTNLKINVWLNPAKDVEDDTTNLRPVIDFIVDNFHQGKVKTHVVQGEFKELVNDIGLDKLDLIYNHNPTVEDHNTIESRDCLHECIRQGIRYVVSDATPINLLFKLAIFEIWGISTSDSIYRNPYFVPVQKGISTQYRYMGYAISLDTLVDDEALVDTHTRRILDMMADALIQCSNIGESLAKAPYINDGVVQIFDGTQYEPDTSIVTCTNSGDKVRLKVTDIAPFPMEAPTTEISLEVARVSWALVLYSRYLSEYKVVAKQQQLAAV